jgi:hypothetical protein
MGSKMLALADEVQKVALSEVTCRGENGSSRPPSRDSLKAVVSRLEIPQRSSLLAY